MRFFLPVTWHEFKGASLTSGSNQRQMAASSKFPEGMSALDPHHTKAHSERVGSKTPRSKTSRTTTVTESYDSDDTLTTIQTETTVIEVVTITPPTKDMSPQSHQPPPPQAPVPEKRFWITEGVWEARKGCYHINKGCQGEVIGKRMKEHDLSSITLREGKLRACLKCGA